MSMKKRVLFVIAVILVVAMTCCMFVACDQKKSDPGISAGTDDGKIEKPVDPTPETPDKDDDVPVNAKRINGDRFSTFVLTTDKSVEEVKSLVNVTLIRNNTSVAVTIAKSDDGKIKIYPPAKGFDLGATYKITLGKGVAFAEYPDCKDLRVKIATDVIRNVTLKDGILTFAKDAVIEDFQDDPTAEGTIRGTMKLQTNAQRLAEGTVFVVEDAKANTKEAYKVTRMIESGAIALMNYVKPEMEDVFQEFNAVSNNAIEDDSLVEIKTDDTERELEGSELATAVIELFGATPTFDVNVAKDGGTLVATVTITVPDVVKVNGFGNTNLTITVTNRLTPTAETNINFKDLQLSFAVDANILNETSCRVTLGSSASYTDIENAQELVQKLTDLAAQSSGKEAGVAVPLFKWTIPIANGAASISYNADLAFRFAFSGYFDVEAKGSLNYQVGVSYDNANGLQCYSDNLKDQFMDSIDITMQGKAEVKVGVIQELSLDIMAGVAGVGIKAELGNYNSLYGNAQTGNLLESLTDGVANLFFEGGFYYDVDLTFGLKIGSLLNLQQAVDITAGEIRLYEAGSEYYALKLNHDNETVLLDAFKKEIPAFSKQVYCMTTSAVTTETVDPADLKFTVADDAKIEIVGNKIIVKDAYKQQSFSETVAVELVGGTALISGGDVYKTTMTVTYQSVFALETADIQYDKSQPSDVSVAVMLGGELSGADVMLEGIDAIYQSGENGGTLTVKSRKFSELDNGVYTFTAKAGDLTAKLNVTVVGKVGLKDSKKAEGIYEIYSADQVTELLGNSEGYYGLTFQLSRDIDMKGAAVSQLNAFEGTLEGEGYAITNYVLFGSGEQTALIKTNKGTIRNVTFAGKVDFAVEGYTGRTYDIAGVALVNEGVIEGVTFEGEVNVTSTGIASFLTFNVAAGVMKGEASVDTQNVAINITYKFDLANVTFNVSGVSKDQVNTKCTAGGGIITKVNVA